MKNIIKPFLKNTPTNYLKSNCTKKDIIFVIIVILLLLTFYIIIPHLNHKIDYLLKNTLILHPEKVDNISSYNPNSIFASVEFLTQSKQRLPQIQDLLTKSNQDLKMLNFCLVNINHHSCSSEINEWVSIITNAMLIPNKKKQLYFVNNAFNSWSYTEDYDNFWKKSDHWASPIEFIKHSGDCEDYSIIKFYTLLKLGFDDKNLRVVILKDLKRNKDHSNLVVYLDEKKYILDNLYVNIYTDEKFKHYKPKYSFNQKNAWIHFQSN